MLLLIKKIDGVIETLEALTHALNDDSADEPKPSFAVCTPILTNADELYLSAAVIYVKLANAKDAVPKDFDDLGMAIEALVMTIYELKLSALMSTETTITEVPEEA